MNNAKYIRFFMFLVEKWGHLQIPVFSFRAGLWKKTGKTSFTQFVVLAPVLQGLYCLLANKFADSQSNPHNRPKAYELIKANNPGLSSMLRLSERNVKLV